MRRFLQIYGMVFFLALISVKVQAQDVTKLLFSKMDLGPQYELWDGSETMLMGFTELMGTPISLPSPTLVFYEGDSVELKLRNQSQAAPHTIHLHGLDVDQQNDGVPHLSFDIGHMETRSYHFKAPHPGTYIYHCHVFSSLHVQAGMYGLLIVKPADGGNTTWTGGYAFNKEYAWMMSEIDVNWHEDSIINDIYDTTEMVHQIWDYEPQYFLVNGKSEHQLSDNAIAIIGEANQAIYLRLANIGNFGNRIIFPEAINATMVSSDGRPLPTVEQSDTVELTPGERYGVMLYPDTEIYDSVRIEYFDLNTQLVINTQMVSVCIEESTGITDYSKSNILKMFPNPADEHFLIEFKNKISESGNISIFNSNGINVYTHQLSKSKEIEIKTSAWAEGIYFMRIEADHTIYSDKIIIKH